MDKEILARTITEAFISYTIEQSGECRIASYDELSDSTKDAYLYLAEKLEQLYLSEIGRFEERLKKAEVERRHLDCLVREAAKEVLRAIGQGMTHAEKNQAICNAVYPLIETPAMQRAMFEGAEF